MNVGNDVNGRERGNDNITSFYVICSDQSINGAELKTSEGKTSI